MTWQWHSIRVRGGDWKTEIGICDPVWMECSDTNISTQSTQISLQMGSKPVLSHLFWFSSPLCLHSHSLSPFPWEIITVSNHAEQYGNDAPEKEYWKEEQRRVIMQHPPRSSVHTVSISLTHMPLAWEQTNIYIKNTLTVMRKTHDWAAIMLLPLERCIKATSREKAEKSKQACVNARNKCQLPRCCSSFSVTYLDWKGAAQTNKTSLFLSTHYIHIHNSVFTLRCVLLCVFRLFATPNNQISSCVIEEVDLCSS